MSIEEDVVAVLALEEPARALLEAFNATWPAISRLDEAGYAGGDWVAYMVGSTTSEDDMDAGPLTSVIKALTWFRESAGNPGAWDYRFFVEDRNQSVAAGAKDILDMQADDEHLDRIKAMRQYAATVA